MKNEILSNLGDPKQLEKLYRTNKPLFKREFSQIYDQVKDNPLAAFWYERLQADAPDISWGTRNEWLFVLTASLLAGLIAKFPEFAGISEDYFYPRNLGFVVFPLLTAYFAWQHTLSRNKTVLVSLATLVAVVYMNLLPDNNKSDSLMLACIHLPLFLWSVLGFSFVSDGLHNAQRRLDFLRYNGDLLVMTGLLLISGALLTAISIGLFSLIGFQVEAFYSRYIVVFGLAASPIIGTYIIQVNPQLVNKVSPVIAKLFSPLVLVTLLIYLGAIIFSGKDPYNDREFLLIFNALLIGVMALILFSVAETSRADKSKLETGMLFLLSLVTVIVNGIALSAILFRISEWGITPNRMAVLGSNSLILINLMIVSYRLYQTIREPACIGRVEQSIAGFLPVYSAWTILVVFVFPLIFGFK